MAVHSRSTDTRTVEKELRMNASPELQKLMLRFVQAAAEGDTVFIDELYSRQPGVLQIGTDPSEWWRGWETISRVWREQIAALGGSMPLVANDVEAWEEGTVGWAAAQGAVQIPEQPELPMRFTAVFRREDGAWKVVQGHGSLGVANEEAAIGELPT
jgi:ketosteroid isomerase-like protein